MPGEQKQAQDISCTTASKIAPCSRIMNVRKLVGGNIRRYRTAIGYTQEKLAVRSDLTPEFLGCVERGVNNISIDALARVAKVLGVPIHKLLLPPEEQKED